jgi:hypothetical protein
MSKKSDKGTGVSFSPELKEVMKRLKRKEPELEETVDQEGSEDHVRAPSGRHGGADEDNPA